MIKKGTEFKTNDSSTVQVLEYRHSNSVIIQTDSGLLNVKLCDLYSGNINISKDTSKDTVNKIIEYDAEQDEDSY